jgi:hypothetical protein
MRADCLDAHDEVPAEFPQSEVLPAVESPGGDPRSAMTGRTKTEGYGHANGIEAQIAAPIEQNEWHLLEMGATIAARVSL